MLIIAIIVNRELHFREESAILLTATIHAKNVKELLIIAHYAVVSCTCTNFNAINNAQVALIHHPIQQFMNA